MVSSSSPPASALRDYGRTWLRIPQGGRKSAHRIHPPRFSALYHRSLRFSGGQNSKRRNHFSNHLSYNRLKDIRFRPPMAPKGEKRYLFHTLLLFYGKNFSPKTQKSRTLKRIEQLCESSAFSFDYQIVDSEIGGSNAACFWPFSGYSLSLVFFLLCECSLCEKGLKITFGIGKTRKISKLSYIFISPFGFFFLPYASFYPLFNSGLTALWGCVREKMGCRGDFLLLKSRNLLGAYMRSENGDV